MKIIIYNDLIHGILRYEVKVDRFLIIEIESNKTSQENYNSHQLLVCTFIGLTELFIRIGFHCKNNTRP